MQEMARKPNEWVNGGAARAKASLLEQDEGIYSVT